MSAFLPVRWRLSISIFSLNNFAQNGLPVRSASPCVAFTGYLLARGWWWRSTSRTVVWISAPRLCARLRSGKSWPILVMTGDLPITAISPPPSRPVLASRRARTASSICNPAWMICQQIVRSDKSDGKHNKISPVKSCYGELGPRKTGSSQQQRR